MFLYNCSWVVTNNTKAFTNSKINMEMKIALVAILPSSLNLDAIFEFCRPRNILATRNGRVYMRLRVIHTSKYFEEQVVTISIDVSLFCVANKKVYQIIKVEYTNFHMTYWKDQ